MFASHAIGRVWCRQGFVIIVAGCLVGSLFSANDVWAQRWQQIEPQMTAREANTLFAQSVNPVLRGAENLQQNQEDFTRYFVQYYFPKMTLHRPSDLADLARDRARFFSRVRSANSQQVQDHLTSIALNTAKAIARGNFHPAVRYNAVLILGDLDQRYERRGAAEPVPHPDATRTLLELLNNDEFNGVPVPESVKLGALVGLQRHSRLGVDAQLVSEVTESALAVLNATDPPADVSRSAYNWLRASAAHVLANLYTEGPTREVHDAFIQFIADDRVSIEDRCFVAGLMKDMDYSNVQGLDGTPAVVAMGRLTKAIAEEGAELARKYQQEVIGRVGVGGGMRRGMGMRGIGRGMGDDEPQFERRQILARLRKVLEGSGSLVNAVQDDLKERLVELANTTKPAREALADRNLVDADVTRPVIDLNRSISTLVGSWQPAEAPGDEEDEFADESDV